MALGASLFFSLATEIIGWAVVYRHDEYKRQVAEVVDLQDKVALMEEKLQYSQGSQSLN